MSIINSDTEHPLAPIASAVAAAQAASTWKVLDNGEEETVLPSGKVARVRRGKGHDLVRAGRIVDIQKDGGVAFIIALCALKTTIDDKPVTYEDLLEFDEEDVSALMAKSQAGKASSPSITSRS